MAFRRETPELALQSALEEHTRYEIVELIGKGGMGKVFKARHQVMERNVALKVINAKLMRNPEAVERFHRAVKTAACFASKHRRGARCRAGRRPSS